MRNIWVDSDACPVRIRDLISRAANKRNVHAIFVANKPVALFDSPFLSCVQVSAEPDAADNYIEKNAHAGDLVITQDIPLAASLVSKGVSVIAPRGIQFTGENVAELLSRRDLMAELREVGEVTTRTPSLDERTIRKFASLFDAALQRLCTIILILCLCMIQVLPAGAQELPWRSALRSARDDIDALKYKDAETKLLGIVREIESRDSQSVELIEALIELSKSYQNEGRLTDSENVAKRAVQIAEMNPPRTQSLLKQGYGTADIATFCKLLRLQALDRLGRLYLDERRDVEAEPLLKRAIDVAGSEKNDLIYPLINLAELYEIRYDFKKAESIYKRVLSIRETVGEPGGLASTLCDLGTCYRNLKDDKQAEAHYLKAIEVLRKCGETNSTRYANCFGYLGYIYQGRKQYSQAEQAFRTNLEILEKNKRSQGNLENLVDTWRDLAEVLVEMGRPEEAEPLYNRILTIPSARVKIDKNVFVGTILGAEAGAANATFKRCFSPNTTDLGTTIAQLEGKFPPQSTAHAKFLEDVAFCYRCFKTKNQPMIPLLLKAMKIRQQLEGANSPNIAEDKHLIAYRLASIGGSFKRPALEAYEIWKKLGEQRDKRLTVWAPSMVRLAYYLASDKSTKPKALEMANLANIYLLSDNNAYGTELDGLGQLYECLGEYGRARSAFDAAANWWLKRSKEAAARVTTNCARICYEQGDLTSAREKLEEAEKLWVQLFGSEYYRNSSSGMSCLEMRTKLTHAEGDLDKAENFARQTLQPIKWRPPNFEVARRYLELAEILALKNKKEEAASHANLAIAQLSNNPNPGYWDELELAKAHALLGSLAISAGKYDQGFTEYKQAFNLHAVDQSARGILGVVGDCNGMALCTLKRKSAGSAPYIALAGCKKLDGYIKTGFRDLSFAEQCTFIKCVSNQFDPMLTIALTDKTKEEVFQYVLRWQGLLIECVRRKAYVLNSNLGARSYVDDIKRTNRELSDLLSGRQQARDGLSVVVRDRLAIRETAERELATIQPPDAVVDAVQDLSSHDFCNLLLDGEAFVDLLYYKDFLTDEPAYVAFVATKARGIQTVRFANARELNKVAQNWFSAMASPAGTVRDTAVVDSDPGLSSVQTKLPDPETLTPATAEKLWQPIKGVLGSGIRKLWICPDSQLSSLPWSVLIDRSEKDQMLASQIDSPRAFVRLRQSQAKLPAVPKVLLVGGIKFAKNSLFLPGTQAEVSDISALVEPKGFSVSKLTGSEPTKAQLLQRLASSNYTHMATHGFFDGAENRTTDSRGVADKLLATQRSMDTALAGSTAMEIVAARDPLALSGLLVAPSEPKKGDLPVLPYLLPRTVPPGLEGRYWPIADDIQDRLTAEELIGEDLSRCQLMVLSACNTGRGKSFEGQGTMGLRAVLLGAGARGILLSLWPVDDQATRKLMTEFYKNLWDQSHPMKPPEALRVAQQSVRTTAGGKWAHPFYWAGWVFDGVGD